MFNQKKSENQIDNIVHVKEKIEALLDHVAQFILIDETLTKKVFSLLIEPSKSNAFSFIVSVEQEVAGYSFNNNHPLVCESLKPGSLQDLYNLNKLFHCDPTIHKLHAINSDYEEFIQWVFYKHLYEEYEVSIPSKINIEKQPIVVFNPKHKSHSKSLPTQKSREAFISDEEMPSLLFMLQDSEISEVNKKEIEIKICKVNSLHNESISRKIAFKEKSNEESQNYYKRKNSFFKPTLANSFYQGSHSRCFSNGTIEEKDGCLFVKDASTIMAFTAFDVLKLDNKGYNTVKLSEGIITGLVEDAVVIYNNQKLTPINGTITAMAFGPTNTNTTNFPESYKVNLGLE